jgi:hypothetical protein
VLEWEWLWVELLSLSDAEDEFTDLAFEVVWVTWHGSPVIEHALWESLATSGGTEVASETERFGDWEEGLDNVHWRAVNRLFGHDHTTLSVEGTVDTANGDFWALNLDGEDWFHDAWASSHHAGVHDTTCGRDDLTATSVNGIGVESDIVDVESDATDVLFAHWAFLGGPLESANNRVLDFVEVLNTLGCINDNVRASSFRTESPDLTCFTDVPFVVVGEVSATDLWIVLGCDLVVVHFLSEVFAERNALHVKTVVLVRRLGEAHTVRLVRDTFSERDDRVGLSERHTGVVFFEILEANFKVEFASAGNNVLTRLFHGDLDHRVRLGETLETFDELWEIGWVLAFDGNTDNWGHGELHDLDVVGAFP